MLTPACPELDRVADVLRRARRVAVLTGAGISAESGLRTFRGGERDMDSLWKSFDPMTLATPQAFARDPETVTRWYDWRRLGCLAAEPNPGHIALAQLEAWLLTRTPDDSHVETGARPFVLLTQNVDRLHHRSGSRNVVELHGSIVVWRCTRTGRELEPGPEPMTAFPPPSPFHDRGVLRPNVVWFGENLPDDALQAAQTAAHLCDVFFSIGTSAVVHPAASFVQQAAARGAATIEINPEPTPISRAVDHSIRAKAGGVLPALVDRLIGSEA